MVERIKVTAQDIKEGVANNSETCAIALAFNRQFGTDDVEVDNAWIYSPTLGISIELTNRVAKFIYQFDRGVRVSPFEFPVRSSQIILDRSRAIFFKEDS